MYLLFSNKEINFKKLLKRYNSSRLIGLRLEVLIMFRGLALNLLERERELKLKPELGLELELELSWMLELDSAAAIKLYSCSACSQ